MAGVDVGVFDEADIPLEVHRGIIEIGGVWLADDAVLWKIVVGMG